MKVIVADDEVVQRRLVRGILDKAGYDIVEAVDGTEALEHLAATDAPALAILDWMMPGLDGVDLCRMIRARRASHPLYLVLLTFKDGRDDVVRGLEAGADDYIVKPVHPSELRARVQVGARILGLQRSLAERVIELERALEHVNQLQGLLPMCAWCHSIRDDQNYWQDVERYISGRSDARFTHTICPTCRSKLTSSAASQASGTPV